MHDLPSTWPALCALVLLLGVRHGFDADHLATINGLTRHNASAGRRFARWCGALFSLGHGAVVVAVALVVGVARLRWSPPGWLEAAGGWVSVAILLALGVVNLRAVLATAPGQVTHTVGCKAALLGGLQRAQQPLGIAAVGAVFALSFDTLGLVALFAVAGARVGGTACAVALGAVFTLGMLLTDAANGLWVSRLLARADAVAAFASRLMGIAVGGASLLVAGFGAARLLGWPVADGSSGGAVVVAVMASGYAAARLLARLARRPASGQGIAASTVLRTSTSPSAQRTV